MLRNRLIGFNHPGRFCLATVLSLVLAAAIGLGWGAEGDVRLEVARQLAARGEYDKSVHELRVYLSEHPEASEIYARIGAIRAKQGNYKLAGENFKIALAKNPNLIEAREGLADAYEKAGDKVRAAEERQKLRKTGAAPSAKMNTDLPPVPGSPIRKEPVAANPVQSDVPFSPALDSGSSKGAQGIYAQKEFQDALRMYREKKIDSALVALRKSLSKSPHHPGAYYLGGVIRYERGDFAKAAFNFKRGFAYPDRGFNSYYYLGRIYQRQEKNGDAIDAYEKYLPLTKSETGKRQVEGYLEQLKGPAKPESKDSEKSAKANEHGADSAKAEEKNAEKPAAETPSVSKAPEPEAKPMLLGKDGPLFFIIPDNASASGKKLMEAYKACRVEKYEQAENTLKETALAYGGSDNAEAASLDMASVYLQLGLWDNARSRLNDYLEGATKDSVKYTDAARYLSALADIGLKDGEKAEKNLLKVKPDAAFAPSQEEIDYRLALAGELLKDSKKWSTYLEKAYASAKTPLRKALMAQKLGFLHAKFGSTDRAMEYFRKSIQDCKDSALAELCPESQLRLADMTFKKKAWKSALAQYKQFAAKYPEHKESAWVHYQMANIYKATNNFESALNEYKKVIDNYPDSYWASQAKWKREDTIWQKEYEEVLD